MKDLDYIDIKILNILQQNSKLTNKEIAEQLGMSTSPVFERIKKLEVKKYITKYVALVDRFKLEKKLMIITMITLKHHTEDIIKEFKEIIDSYPEVTECFHVSGNADFILKVYVEGIEEYHSFLTKKLVTFKHIDSVNSSFVFKEVKSTTQIPLSEQ